MMKVGSRSKRIVKVLDPFIPRALVAICLCLKLEIKCVCIAQQLRLALISVTAGLHLVLFTTRFRLCQMFCNHMIARNSQHLTAIASV